MSTHLSSCRWIFIIFLVYPSAQIITGEAPSTLKFTSILFRHGDRSPIRSFPGDRHNESAWPQGFGQLSQVGMEQEFQLGQYIRKRYMGFLDEEYLRSQVYVQSTTLDRTIMSAQSVLAGLYPPAAEHWNKEKQWQPIPVHIIDANNEKMLRYNASRCPTLDKVLDEIYNNSVVRQLRAKNKLFLEKINNATGGYLTDIRNISGLVDTLLCEKIHGMSWPTWMDEDMYERLKSIKLELQGQRFCSDNRFIRLTGGLFLGHIIKDMHLKARHLMEQDLRAAVYSAHDTTVLILMCAMGVYNDRLVPYSTSMYVELHHQGPDGQDDDKLSGWYVQVWLRNETDSAPYPLTIPGCSFNCSLSDFANLTKGNITTDWSAECGLFTIPGLTQLWHIVLITMGSGLGLLLLIFLITSCGQGKCVRRRLRPRPSTYGKLRASEVITRPEEMPMIGTTGGDSDIEG